MKKFIVLLLIAVFMIPVNLPAAEKIIFAVADFPPYQYEENNKEPAGIGTDIVREISKRLGFELELRLLPWKRALRDAKMGDITGLVAAYKTEERSEYLLFSSESMYMVKNIIVAKKESDIRVTSLDDLKDKVIGVFTESSYGPEFDNHKELKKEYVNTLESLLKMLDKRRMDVVATHNGPFNFISKKLGIKENFKVLYTMSEDPLYIAVSKAKGKEGEALINKFSETLRQMKFDGMAQKIIGKYE